MYEDIVQLVIMLSIISVAVERTLEIIKSSLNLDARLKTSNSKKLTYFSLSTVIGAIIYLINPDQHLIFVTTHLGTYSAPVIIGLAASSGSGVWHEILKIITGMNLKS